MSAFDGGVPDEGLRQGLVVLARAPMAGLNRVGQQPYRGDERRRAELQELRHAADQAQALWRRLADLNADDPERPQLAAQLDAIQARVIALKLRHRL